MERSGAEPGAEGSVTDMARHRRSTFRRMRNSMWKGTGAAALAVAGVLLLGACSDDGDDGDDNGEDTTEAPSDTGGGTTEAPSDGGGDGLTISGFTFSDTTAAAGSTVTVTNEDG